ncbi:MAG: hypothetical protein M0P27_00520 [Bacteroidales bacterium]|nr:hypothetical protein [Bacteroidales bacterium]
MIAGTATGIRIAGDFTGQYIQDDRRVFAIIPKAETDMAYLLGVLNSPVPNFIFKLIARPKANGFYDIEQQFLAPLPIPNATDAEKQAVGSRALALQAMHTRQRDLINKIERRLQGSQMIERKHAPGWLWADAKSVGDWAKSPEKPADLKGRALTAWAKEQAALSLQHHLDELDARLNVNAEVLVENDDAELRLLINGVAVVELFDKPDTPLIAAQWRQFARTTNITEKFDGKKLLAKILSLRSTKDETLKNSIIVIDQELQLLDLQIAAAEEQLNEIIFQLYRLTPEEIALVKGSA